MSKLTDSFIVEAKNKKVKFNERIIEQPLKNASGEEIVHKQLVLQTALQVKKNKIVPCAVVIHDTDKLTYVNYQMNYNKIGFVTDRNELPNILEKLNELNSMKSGYYHFLIKPDGELFMKHLGVLGNDPVPAVNIFIHGSKILRLALPELEKINGLDLSSPKN